MSKKRRRRKDSRQTTEPKRSTQSPTNSPFGINPMQLMSMLGGNMDMGQLGNMLSSLKMDGLDLNNFNLGQNNNNNNPMNEFELGSLQNMMKNLGMESQVNQNVNLGKANSRENNLNIDYEDDFGFESNDDENIKLLESIKSIVDPSKINFIDKIIEAYENGSIK